MNIIKIYSFFLRCIPICLISIAALFTTLTFGVQPVMAAPSDIAIPSKQQIAIPQGGALFGHTYAYDTQSVPGCESGYTKMSTFGLDCKVNWSAHKQGLLSSNQTYVSGLDHIYIGGGNGCHEGLGAFGPSGNITKTANTPGRKLLLMNVKCGDSWSSFANKSNPRDEADIKAIISAANKLPVPVVLTYWHEPEDDACGKMGTPNDFRKAFRRFAQYVSEVENASGRFNVATATVLMGIDYKQTTNRGSVFSSCSGISSKMDPHLRNPEMWWPGDDAVDWIGADPYTEFLNKSFLDEFKDLHNWASAACPASGIPSSDYNCTSARQQKPIAIFEWGPQSVRIDHAPSAAEIDQRASALARWFDDAVGQIGQLPKIRAYSYWSSVVVEGNCALRDVANQVGMIPGRDGGCDKDFVDTTYKQLDGYTRFLLKAPQASYSVSGGQVGLPQLPGMPEIPDEAPLLPPESAGKTIDDVSCVEAAYEYAGTDTTDTDNGPCVPVASKSGGSVYSVLLTIINFLSIGVGIAVVGGIVWGSMRYIASNGNPGEAEAGTKIIIAAIVGLLLFIFLYAIVNFLVPGGVFN